MRYLIFVLFLSTNAAAQKLGNLRTLCTLSDAITAIHKSKKYHEDLLIKEKIDQAQAAMIIDTLQADIYEKTKVALPYLAEFKAANGRNFSATEDCKGVKR